MASDQEHGECIELGVNQNPEHRIRRQQNASTTPPRGSGAAHPSRHQRVGPWRPARLSGSRTRGRRMYTADERRWCVALNTQDRLFCSFSSLLPPGCLSLSPPVVFVILSFPVSISFAACMSSCFPYVFTVPFTFSCLFAYLHVFISLCFCCFLL